MKRLLHPNLNLANGGSETNFRIERGIFFIPPFHYVRYCSQGGRLQNQDRILDGIGSDS